MMIVTSVAALAIAPIIATGVDPKDSSNTNTSGDTYNTGNSENSGNFRSESTAINSGNFGNANGGTNSNNAAISTNLADGRQKIIVIKRLIKRKC
ncbi:hypothetical protein [Acrocarpospora catenulata]|uniref:hypothetical protein n=1 Tax=Acrocarpospora catenulata TaxID=2836182 RepID=UPI001BDABD80|nr:hypothetical protein [Acrocarpospora catenulata]